MTSTTEVMPCPHCGNSGTRDPRHTFHWNHMQRTVSVQCGQCLATGPFARLLRSGRRAEDEALRLWNERKTPNAAVQPRAEGTSRCNRLLGGNAKEKT